MASTSPPGLALWWHPRLIASGIGVLAAGVGVGAVLGGGLPWAGTACWLLAAAAAGYAASGST